MKKLFALFLVVAMVASVALPFASSVDAAGNASGKVIDREGDGIDGVNIEIYNSAGTTLVKETDTVGGAFGLTGLGSDPLKMKVIYEDHVVSHCSLGTADSKDMYDLDASADVSGILIIMETGDVTVTFHVIKEDGKGLANVDIAVTPADPQDAVQTCKTDAAGMCTFTVDRTAEYTVSFVMDPYAVYSSPQMTVLDDGTCEMDFVDALGASVTYNVLMTQSYVTVEGDVRNTNGDLLGEVVIVFKSADGVERRTSTERGHYEMKQILIGKYDVTVSRSDYKTYTGTVDVMKTADGRNVINFELESTSDTYLFGLDLPHSFMIGGAIIGILVILIVSVYRYNLGRKYSEGSDSPSDDDVPKWDDE